MSSFDKTVKLACKPKAAPPKAKYIDPIIAATYSEDGAIHDVCKALSPRFREPNAIVVFKALIVLHTMIRNGATDNVLTYLSTEDVLKLRNVSNGQWEGYNAPKNLQNYAAYLDIRIRTYRELKHDPVRVQADSNRDLRVENAINGGGGDSSSSRPNGRIQRSKTLAGRKLRSMTVEKGLLRETKAVQKTIASLLDCKMYLDNLEDELNVTALRMLVKDLLILFQASNEGVMNVLENFFEMSKIDGESALNIYRTFCKQTERIVEYLGVAKKLQNLLNIPIPNLKFAPVSLATALEDYLKDPNFEQKRAEAMASKANHRNRAGNKSKLADKSAAEASSSTAESGSSSSAANGTTSPPKDAVNKDLVDFFSSIEEVQQPMFNPVTNSPSSTFFQQQAVHNPFAQRQSVMMTGAFQQQPFMQPQMPQQTGFIQPQATAVPGPFQMNAFAQPAMQQTPNFPFLQTQPTGFLQPQQTGSNPFRQSMLLPQSTGFPNFNVGVGGGMGSSSPFGSPAPQQFGQNQPLPHSAQASLFSQQSQTPAGGFPGQANGVAAGQIIQRPASTPITSDTSKSFGQVMQPVVSHQTGSRNPFGIPQQLAPPVPKAPTLAELKTGMFANPQTTQSQGQPSFSSANTSADSNLLAQTGSSSKPADGSTMADIATSFSFNNAWSVDPGKKQGAADSPSLMSQATSTSAFSSQPTGTTISAFSSHPTGTTSATSPSLSFQPLQAQTTGFSALKAFKPTSSFGASLLESLPPIPQGSEPAENASNSRGLPSTASPLSSFTGVNGASGASSSPFSTGAGAGSTSTIPAFPFLNSQPTGFPSFNAGATSSNSTSTIGVGLRPQLTGGGIANPFRASMFTPSSGGGITSLSSSLGNNSSGLSGPNTTNQPFSSNLFTTNSPSMKQGS